MRQFKLHGAKFFFSSRRRHTRLQGDWSSDVCSSDLEDHTGTDWPCSAQGGGVYCGKVLNLFGESAMMAVEQVEQVTEQVPADDFQALEDKIYRTIEMYKAARQAQAAAERDAQRVRQQMQDREEELVTLRRETVRLKKEREEIRGRVEKMLQQIESIAEAS